MLRVSILMIVCGFVAQGDVGWRLTLKESALTASGDQLWQ